MALAEAFNTVYAFQKDLKNIYKIPIPVFLLTDSLSLFDFIIRASSMTEERLLIDAATVRDSY